MRHQASIRVSAIGLIILGIFLAACSASPTPAPVVGSPAPTSEFSNWVKVKMTDVQTGQSFAISDFEGKVVLIETIAEWCPNCLFQQGSTKIMHRQLGNPEDLILISLDVDAHEDEASLKQYAADNEMGWRFAVAPLEVQRALGNLYSAEYLNPPLEPMLLIDRQGNAHQLPYGLKKPEDLQKLVEPYLAK